VFFVEHLVTVNSVSFDHCVFYAWTTGHRWIFLHISTCHFERIWRFEQIFTCEMY